MYAALGPLTNSAVIMSRSLAENFGLQVVSVS